MHIYSNCIPYVLSLISYGPSSHFPLFQRVYGISFPDKKKLKEYKKMIKAAEERDHRLIGKNQELFFFDKIRSLYNDILNIAYCTDKI